MIDSIEQLTLKTGQEVIIMNHMDIIDTIRDTLGDPLVESYGENCSGYGRLHRY